MNCHANKSIECTVVSCANHCDEANYCSLDKILCGLRCVPHRLGPGGFAVLPVRPRRCLNRLPLVYTSQKHVPGEW